MYKVSIENALPRAYSNVVEALSAEHVQNKIASWKYKKPIFSIEVVEGHDLTEFINGLVAAVEGQIIELPSDPVSEPAIETAPEPIIEAALEPVVEVAPEPVIEVVPEPVVEVKPKKSAPPDPRNKKGLYVALVWIAHPAIMTPDPVIGEAIESKTKPWTMMLYKKMNDNRRGPYPDKVVRVEVWFEGTLVDEFPVRSTV